MGDGLALSHAITNLYEMGAHRERSKCPIAYSLDVLGDRWTLLVLRDLAFKNRRYFRDFLGASEGISSNILTERLRRLQHWNLITKVSDPKDGRPLGDAEISDARVPALEENVLRLDVAVDHTLLVR